MQQVAAFFGLILLSQLLIADVSAHISGVPFLKINGQFASANVSYFDHPNLGLVLPQDLGLEKYLVDTPLQFEIDATVLPLQKEVIPTLAYRWDWGDGTPTGTGLKDRHTYTQIGSYLVTLGIKQPTDSDFTTYNTIQVEVVSSETYQLPEAKIYIDQTSLRSGQPIKFRAQINTNPGNQIKDYWWFVDGQKFSNQTELTYTFPDDDFFNLVFLRYTDDLGFTGSRAVWLQAKEGVITLPFPPNSKDEVEASPKLTTEDQTGSALFDWVPWLVGGAVILPLIIVLVLFLKKKK
jgi:hypothetical protein